MKPTSRMKAKSLGQYQFIVTVKGALSSVNASNSILCCFARRYPDGMEFYLKRHRVVVAAHKGRKKA